MNENATVYIVDDDQAVREAVARLVKDMGLNSKSYSSAEEFLKSYERIGADCLVLDVRMTGMSGIALLEKLSEENIPIPAILVTGHGDIKMAVNALKKGAVDFIEKPFREQDLWDRIEAAVEVSDDNCHTHLEQDKLTERISCLSSQEHEILKYLFEGKTDKQIAVDLEFTRRTAAYHRTSILKKLEIENVIELAKSITRYGIAI